MRIPCFCWCLAVVWRRWRLERTCGRMVILSYPVWSAGAATKACHLSVNERVYWRHAGLRKLNVEPFATYELTAWVRQGEDRPCTALYAYSYNCYGWFNGTEAGDG